MVLVSVECNRILWYWHALKEKKELERLREKKLEMYQKISEDNERIEAQTKQVMNGRY